MLCAVDWTGVGLHSAMGHLAQVPPRVLQVREPAPRAPDARRADIVAARFVLSPERFDVVEASNLFGNILADLGPACTGTIAIALSANLNPERTFPSLFEPVHGSAPDIYGQKIANPIGMVWLGAMMLDFLDNGDCRHTQEHDAILRAIERYAGHRSAHVRHGRHGQYHRCGQGDCRGHLMVNRHAEAVVSA